MLKFEFATATRIVFGAGEFKNLGKYAAGLGKCALVVTGSRPESGQAACEVLEGSGVEAAVFAVNSEPAVEQIDAGVRAARAFSCDLVIGFGGGSAVDSAKAIAALAANPGDILDYVEVVGRGQPLPNPPLAFIAVPTTAGTGTEVTRNAVIRVPDKNVKVSLRSPRMLAKLALVDPEQMYSAPPQITAASGLDALTQLIEPYVCNRPNPIIDALCRDGIRKAAVALPRAYHDGLDKAARENMALASLYGGLALANANLGAVHGFAAVVGGMYAAPHGAVCARLLPFVSAQNVAAMRTREPLNPAVERYREVAVWLTGDPQASIEDGLGFLHRLIAELNIPPLSSYRLQEADFDVVVEKAARASSYSGNPIKLTEQERRWIVEQAF